MSNVRRFMTRIATISAALFASAFFATADAQPASGVLQGIAAKRPSSYGPAYPTRLIEAIKSNIVVADPVPKLAAVEVEITTEPNGRIASYRLVKSSGVQAWDEAVMRAVAETERLPLAPDGTVPPLILAVFRPSAP